GKMAARVLTEEAGGARSRTARGIAAKLEPLSAEQRERAAMAGPREPSGCTIFLGFTSNLVSSGVRESIRYLVQRGMGTVTVTWGHRAVMLSCWLHGQELLGVSPGHL
uniref:Deoxyhypusine synthase n=1 Tax=Junco hyemalis TaxID=40217 RepID=A0A8C5IG79_JUNHY